MPDDTDDADILETATDVSPDETEEEDTDDSQEESSESDSLKAKLVQAEEYGRNQKIRAEKAEKLAKEQVQKEQVDLTSKDTIALINAKVHEDDVDEVVEYAKFKKISLPEALKSSVVKTLLSERAEQRSTAEATSTGKTRSGHAKQTGESLLARAQKTGELPDRPEDLEILLEQRLKPK